MHNKTITPEEVRAKFTTDTEDGVSLYELCIVAELYGFKAQGVQGEYKEFLSSDVPMPIIAHLDDGFHHFIVVHKFESETVTIADPREGVRILSRDEFVGVWTGYALLIWPPKTS